MAFQLERNTKQQTVNNSHLDLFHAVKHVHTAEGTKAMWNGKNCMSSETAERFQNRILVIESRRTDRCAPSGL